MFSKRNEVFETNIIILFVQFLLVIYITYEYYNIFRYFQDIIYTENFLYKSCYYKNTDNFFYNLCSLISAKN